MPLLYATQIEFDCVDLTEVLPELLPLLKPVAGEGCVRLTITPVGPGGGNPCVMIAWLVSGDAGSREVAIARRSAARVRAWLAANWMSWLEDAGSDNTHDYADGLESHDHEFIEGDSCPGCEASAATMAEAADAVVH